MSLARLRSRFVARVGTTLFQRYGIPRTREEVISKRFISRFIGRAPVIVDCGAHIGDDTLEMAALWPTARIHAFEPVPEIFYRLESRVRELNNVKCYNFAVSDYSGTQQMYISSGRSDGSSSLLSPTGHRDSHPDVRFDRSAEVPVVTFGDWAAQLGLDQIDLFWLDMQGSELQALRASGELLKRASAIHTEVSTRPTYHGAALYPELRQWLESRGFSVAVEAIPVGWDMGNVLFVRRGITHGG
jgi:FkbM family methyltransferase